MCFGFCRGGGGHSGITVGASKGVNATLPIKSAKHQGGCCSASCGCAGVYIPPST